MGRLRKSNCHGLHRDASSQRRLRLGGAAHAEDKLLTEAVNFTGTITYLTTKVPGFMLVAVRNGEMAFAGFGKITDKGDKTPDADTMFRIGSISKVFCGEVLASMVLDGKVRFSDRLQDRLGYDVTLPERAGHPIRLDRPRDPDVWSAARSAAA